MRLASPRPCAICGAPFQPTERALKCGYGVCCSMACGGKYAGATRARLTLEKMRTQPASPSRAARLAANLTMPEAAERLGITAGRLSVLECEGCWSFPMALRAADLYGCAPSRVLKPEHQSFDPTTFRRFQMDGREVVAVRLTNGKESLIDAEDLPDVGRFIWWETDKGYVARHYVEGNLKKGGRLARMQLARQLLKPEGDGRKVHVDHINGDRFNNRRCNLRVCSVSENLQNLQKPPRHSTTGHLGVSFMRQARTYRAYLVLNGRQHHLGCYRTLEEAAEASRAGRQRLMPASREARELAGVDQ